MAETSVRSDGWDRARVMVTWLAAAALPLWLLLTVVVLELRRDTLDPAQMVFTLLPDGTLVQDSGTSTARQVGEAFGSAGLGMLAVSMVVAPLAWAFTRGAWGARSRSTSVIDPSLLEGAEWVVTVHRGSPAPAEASAPQDAES